MKYKEKPAFDGWLFVHSLDNLYPYAYNTCIHHMP